MEPSRKFCDFTELDNITPAIMMQMISALALWARDELPKLRTSAAEYTWKGITVSAVKFEELTSNALARALVLGIRVGVGGFPLDPYLVEVRQEYFEDHFVDPILTVPKLRVYPSLVVRARTGSARVVFATDPVYAQASWGLEFNVQRLSNSRDAPVPVQEVTRGFRLQADMPPDVESISLLVRSDMCVAIHVGGVRVRAPANYTVFGVTVPASRFCDLVIQTPQHVPFFAGWLEFNRVNMDFGALSRLPSDLLMPPHLTVNAPDAVPEVEHHPPTGAIARECVWHGGTKYLFHLDTEWFRSGVLAVHRNGAQCPLRLLVAPHGNPRGFFFELAGVGDSVSAHTCHAGTYVGDTTTVVPDMLTPDERAVVESAVDKARLALSPCAKL